MSPTELSSGALGGGSNTVAVNQRFILTGIDLDAAAAAASVKVYDGTASDTLIGMAACLANDGDHVSCNARGTSGVMTVVVAGAGAEAVVRYK